MKNLKLLIAFMLVTMTASAQQFLFHNPVPQWYDYLRVDKAMYLRYLHNNSSMDSILAVDANGKVMQVIKPAGGGGGGSITSVNGQTGPTVTLTTDQVPEGANKYYTDARAQTANTAGTGLNRAGNTLFNTGVLSVNGATGAVTIDTTYIANFAAKVRSLFGATAPLIYYNGNLSLPVASGGINGYLSGTDWTTFNGKAAAFTKGNLTEATSNILTITGGTAAVIGSGTTIQIKQASSIQAGYLSATDYSAFTGKAPPIVAGAGITYNVGTGTVANTGVLTVNGSTGNVTVAAGRTINPVNGLRLDSTVTTTGGGGGGSGTPGPGTSYTFNPDGSGRLIIDNTSGTYHAGDTLRLTGSYKVVQLTNFVGTLANPIVLMNTAGQVTNIGDSTWGGGSYSEGFLLMGCHYMQIRGTDSAHLIFTGSKNTTDDGNGYQVRGAYKDISFYGFSDHIELAYCWIRHGGQGIFAKMEVIAGDPRTWYSGGNALRGFSIHDLRLDSTYNEGMYLGHTGTFWDVTTNAPYYPNSGQATVDTTRYKRPIYLTGVKVYNNLVRGTGFDGIQTATIDTLEVYNNEVINWGTRHVSTDCGGILIGGRTANTNTHDNVVHNAFGEPIQFYGNGYNSLNTTTGTYHTFTNNLIYRTEYGDGFSMAGYDNPIVTITNQTTYATFNNSTRVNGTRAQTTPVVISKSYLILPYQHNTGTVFDSYYLYTENGGSFTEGTAGNANGKYATYAAAFSATGIDTLNYFLPTSGTIGYRSNGNLGPKAPSSSGSGGTTTTAYLNKLGGPLTEYTNIPLNGHSFDIRNASTTAFRVDSLGRLLAPGLKNNVAKDSILATDANGYLVQVIKPTGSGGSGNGTSVGNTQNVSANYTASSTDNTLLVNNTTAITITLPSAATTPGIQYHIKKTSNNSSAITIATTSSQTIDGQPKVIYNVFRDFGGFRSDGAGWYLISGVNTNPLVYAGADQTTATGATTATLVGTASAYSGRTVTHAWTQLSGPNTATMATNTALSNALSGLTAGTYLFQLKSTDNITAYSTDTVGVTVPTSAVVAQWKFSAADNTAVTGINNVLGSPITAGNYSATYSDAATGSGISLVSLATSGNATTIWGASYGATNNAGDANGETTSDGGGFIVPQGYFANAWFNYQKTTPVNQFKFTGLNPAKTYKITFVPSLKTSFGLDANPTQYQINGGTAQNTNAVGNTSHAVIFTGQVPTGAGELPWFVGPVATLSEFGMLNYVKIESE